MLKEYRTELKMAKKRGKIMSDRHFVKKHNIKEGKGPIDPYNKWCNSHPTRRRKGDLGDRFDMVTEDARANPDSLREEEAMFADSQPSTPQLLMGEAVEHLQGRQLEVYFLTMREGKSLAEAAEILGIEKGSAQRYKERAIKFILQYCQAAISRGRV
jgi:DNA-directed RNA polymerase specialized sigma24 family protein